MTRPSSEALAAIVEPVAAAMAELAVTITPEQAQAWSVIVNFIAVSQRVMAKTNPSKLRDEARTVWIQNLSSNNPSEE